MAMGPSSTTAVVVVVDGAGASSWARSRGAPTACAVPPVRDAHVRASALGERGAAATNAVDALAVVARSHDDPLCREAAVAALGAIGDRRGLDVVLGAASGDRPAVRRRAVVALAAFDGPEVEAALRAALDDRDWQVRQAAEDLLDG